MTKLCVGCKHLVPRHSADLCAATDPKWVQVTDPHTGTTRLQPEGGYRFRPDVGTMRAPDAKCGPDAVLWAPNLRRRFMYLLTRNPRWVQP